MKPRNTASIKYPDNFPQPLMSGYSVTEDHGTVATRFANGWTRQRRLSPWTYRAGQLTFRMNVEMLKDWHQWVHLYGFGWTEMKVQDSRPLPSADPYVSTRMVRFTGSASYTYGDWDYVDVAIPCEFMIDEAEVPA